MSKKLQELSQSTLRIVNRAVYINESWLYRLILTSRKPQAEPFQDLSKSLKGCIIEKDLAVTLSLFQSHQFGA